MAGEGCWGSNQKCSREVAGRHVHNPRKRIEEEKRCYKCFTARSISCRHFFSGRVLTRNSTDTHLQAVSTSSLSFFLFLSLSLYIRSISASVLVWPCGSHFGKNSGRKTSAFEFSGSQIEFPIVKNLPLPLWSYSPPLSWFNPVSRLFIPRSAAVEYE